MTLGTSGLPRSARSSAGGTRLVSSLVSTDLRRVDEQDEAMLQTPDGPQVWQVLVGQ